VEDDEAFQGTADEAALPFAKLLNPAWLPARWRLEVTGQVEHAGRAGYAVTGYERSRHAPGLPGAQVSAVVDAELGILLHYELAGPGRRPESAGFTRLDVASAADADTALFSCPAGVTVTKESRESPPRAADDSVPVAGRDPEVSDALIGLLYAAALGPRRFSAVLRERADGGRRAAVFRIPLAGVVSAGLGRAAAKISGRPGASGAAGPGYSGAWLTASTLLPSGSRTNAP
jgi:hypothetical protein